MEIIRKIKAMFASVNDGRKTKQAAWLSLFFINTIVLCVANSPVFMVAKNPYYYLFYLSQNVFFALVLGVALLPFFFTHRAIRLPLLALIESLSLFYIFMNAKVFAFWHVFINSSLIHLFLAGGSQVFEISLAMYAWLFTALVIWLAAGALLIVFGYRFSDKFSSRKIITFFIVLYIAAQVAFLRAAKEDHIFTLQETMQVPYFYDTSWVNFLEKLGVSIFPNDSLTEQLQHALNKNVTLDYPLHPLTYHVPAHPLNVLLIVVDTLRYDMINPVNMPNVFQFSKNASVFLDNISGGDCTRPGIFSLFYGIPATNWPDALNEQTPSVLVKAFQDNHYDLKLLGSASLAAPPFNRTVFASIKHLKILTKGDGAAGRDLTVTNEMTAFLQHESQTHHPFFGFIFYDGPHAYNAMNFHTPFSPAKPLNYFDVRNSTNPVPIFNMYKNAVFYDDHLIQTILTTLKKDGLSKNTVVVFTSDHGQEFNEYHNDYWEHASGFSKYQIRTPLLIAWPGMQPKTYDHQTTHFDLPPTLLKRVLGVSNPVSDYSVGDDFFSPRQPNFAIIGNYAYYAVSANNEVIEIHDSGLYRLYSAEMKPLENSAIDPVLMQKVIKQIQTY